MRHFRINESIEKHVKQFPQRTLPDLASDLFPPPVMDIEASGFGLGSYPIEIGFVLPNGNAWCSLVRPEPEWQHWDPNAAAVHGITRDTLLSTGRSVHDIAKELNEQLSGMTIYTDAWAHDYTWLSRLYEVAGRTPAFKLDNLRVLLTEAEAENWHRIKAKVATAMGLQRHRASADARLLQQTLAAMRPVKKAAA